MFEPLKLSLSDFRITDIVDSKIVERDQIEADTNMILINSIEDNEELRNIQLARVLMIVKSCNPKTIGIKKIIRKSDFEKENELLAMVLKETPNLVFSIHFEDFDRETNSYKKIERSDRYFTQFGVEGFDNFLAVYDERVHTIRHFTPKMKVGNKEYNSFSVELVKKYKPEAIKKLKSRNKEQEMINYLGNYHFSRMEVEDILNRNFEPEYLRNKLVVIGRISTRNGIDSNMALEDVFFTPLNDSYTGKAFPDMYGSILHANIMSMIINGNYLASMPNWIIIIISILLVYFNMVIFTYITVRNKKWYEIFSLLVFVIESILILAATIISFIYYKYEMNLTIPIFAIALSIIIYEIYHSSMKPLTIKTYYKFIHKGY
jgi:CHASE2 domain-containing sensor protein